MLVNDESDFRSSTQALLEEKGYRVSAFENGLRAFKGFRKHPDQFDLIITDMMMTKMTGETFAKLALNIRPDMLIFVWTGSWEIISEENLKRMGIKKYIQKPIKIDNLVAMIDDALLNEN